MSIANPKRTQLNEGDVISVNYMELMSEPEGPCVGPYEDCMNGVCEHVTAMRVQPTEAQKEFRTVYESLSEPESDERTSEVGEVRHKLKGLSDDDCSLLVQALYALNDHAMRGKTYDACMAMIDRIYEIY